nr:probable galactinol--sucrose galactosyltransferase 1 isoform X2 [Nicotiana tomentosiformis]
MTITGGPIIKDECLTVRGKVVLTGVPENIVITSASSSSAFLGAKSMTISSHHVFNLGVLEDYKFLCLFIVKIWWMIPRVGKIRKRSSNGNSDASPGSRRRICCFG